MLIQHPDSLFGFDGGRWFRGNLSVIVVILQPEIRSRIHILQVTRNKRTLAKTVMRIRATPT